MFISKKNSGYTDDQRLLEVVDKQNRPLAVLPKDLIHRQLLWHRSVQVTVFSPDKKIYLQKRNSRKRFFPGRWDVSARVHPMVGEAVYSAAQRALKTELRLEIDQLQHAHELPSSPETGFEFISIFNVLRNTQPIIPNPDEVSEGYYYSQEELTCLVKGFRELLTPNLVTLWEAGLLFPG